MLRALARILPLWVPAVGLAILAVPDPPTAPPSYQPDPELGARPFVECPGLAVQVARWQRVLRLEHWQLTTYCGMDPGFEFDSWGLTRYGSRSGQRAATIWIQPRLEGWQEPVVVHELAHLYVTEHYRFDDDDLEEEWVDLFSRSVLRPRLRRLRAERAAQEAALASAAAVASLSSPD